MKSLIDCKDIRAFTKDETKYFLTFHMMEESGDFNVCELESQLNTCMGYKIMSKRLEITKVEVTATLKAFLTMLCETPAKAVMWAYTLCVIANKLNTPEVAFIDFVNTFPMGIPTDDAMHKLWDEQKDPNAPMGNKLDDMRNWVLTEKEN